MNRLARRALGLPAEQSCDGQHRLSRAVCQTAARLWGRSSGINIGAEAHERRPSGLSLHRQGVSAADIGEHNRQRNLLFTWYCVRIEQRTLSSTYLAYARLAGTTRRETTRVQLSSSNSYSTRLWMLKDEVLAPYSELNSNRTCSCSLPVSMHP